MANEEPKCIKSLVAYSLPQYAVPKKKKKRARERENRDQM